MNRDTSEIGKVGELDIMSEFIKEGFEVFVPLVDKGVDFVAKKGDQYFEIQVKTRNDTPIFSVKAFKPRKNFYIVCYYITNTRRDIWIIPSDEYKKYSKIVKNKKQKYFRLDIHGENKRKLQIYRFNFDQFSSPGKQRTRQLVKGKHLKESDFYIPILMILDNSKQPLKRKEIVEKIKDMFSTKFSKYDHEKVSGKMERWEKNVRWAVTNLKRKGLITSKGRNNWVITDKGREYLNKILESMEL